MQISLVPEEDGLMSVHFEDGSPPVQCASVDIAKLYAEAFRHGWRARHKRTSDMASVDVNIHPSLPPKDPGLPVASSVPADAEIPDAAFTAKAGQDECDAA